MNGIAMEFIVWGFITLASALISIFLFLRSIKMYRDWRDGDKDERWIFLSFILGAIALILIAWGSATFVVGDLAILTIAVSLLIGLASIALATVYYILKWMHIK